MVETRNKGYVCQIIGPVLDIEFPDGILPPIYSAIRIETADGIGNIVEVQQLLGDNKVRGVSMRSTDGLKRGVEAIDLGTPILVPVGTPTLGRIFNSFSPCTLFVFCKYNTGQRIPAFRCHCKNST